MRKEGEGRGEEKRRGGSDGAGQDGGVLVGNL